MNNLNWKQGLLRLYYTLWVIGAGFTFITSVYWSFFEGKRVDFFYIGAWLGLAVIAPAAALKLILWITDGFARKGA